MCYVLRIISVPLDRTRDYGQGNGSLILLILEANAESYVFAEC